MNKKVIIGIVAAVVVVILVGALLMKMHSGGSTSTHPTYGADATLPKISADQIGFTVKKVDDHNIKIYISKTDGLKSFTYDAIYDAYARDENNQPLTDKIDRDAQPDGPITLTSGKSYVSDAILLGSCSTGGKCVYDTGTTKITTDLRVTKADGSQYQTEYILNVGQTSNY